ncbi:MAG: TolC family protein [Pirellulaceae bacterium]
MAMRFLAFSVLLGSVVISGGCLSLHRYPGPRTGLAKTADQGVRSSATVQLATFDEPSETGSRESSALLPVPGTNKLANVPLQPQTIQEALNPAVKAASVQAEVTTIDLDLTGALSLATGQNPQIEFAAARYRESYARLEAAYALWLPSLRAGVSFNHHDGTLQTAGGGVIDASRSSFQQGLGAGAVAAGSPVVPGVSSQFHSADAVFQPIIAEHSASAHDAAMQVTTNDTLLATALAYLDLLRTTQQLRISEETRDNAKQLADLTSSFASTGQGSQADANRARTELIRHRVELSRAKENRRVASARLAEFLSLDPAVEIVPQESTIVPIDLVSLKMSTGELLANGLENRPELAELQFLVCEAVYRYRREKYAPMLPSVLLGVSQSSFGGGLGSNIDNRRKRFDFDATVYWELRNFGFGERAKRDETRSRYDQVEAQQVGMLDRVAREVVEAHEQAKSRKEQIDISKLGIKSATNAYQRDLERIREGEGLPIEALQSIQALDQARRLYLRSVVDYNAAQFRLQRALGWPIQ